MPLSENSDSFSHPPQIVNLPKKDRSYVRSAMTRVPDSEFQAAQRTAHGSLILEHAFFDDGDMRLHRAQRAAGTIEMEGQARHRVWVHARASSVRLRLGDDRYSGTSHRGALSLCPAGAPAAAVWDQPVDLLVLSIAPRFVTRILEGSAWDATPFFHVQDAMVSQILRLLSKEAEIAGSRNRLYREGLATALVAHLARGSSGQSSKTTRHGLAPARLRQVLAFLEDHLADDISLAVLAAEAGVSERHFCTMFGRATGRSPHRFIIEQRLARAKKLLRSNPSESLTEVAMKVGFKSSAHFSATFRKAFNTTPSAYRRDS